MPQKDPQPGGRVVHVCPDPLVGAVAAQAARRCGLAYARFTDAYAAALELLTQPASRPILLLALDGVSRAEQALAEWAAGRWPEMVILAHAPANRANGGNGSASPRVVPLEMLEQVLSAGLVQPVPQTGAAPSPGPASPAAIETAKPPEPAHGPAAAEAGSGVETTVGPPRQPGADAVSQAEPVGEQPALRVHPLAAGASGQPLLTEAELSALLGPQEDNDGAG